MKFVFISIFFILSNTGYCYRGYFVELETNCYCKTGFSPDSVNNLIFGDEYQACVNKFDQIHEKYQFSYEDKKREIEASQLGDEALLCSESKTKEWFKLFKDNQKISLDTLEKEVNEKVCGAKGVNKGKSGKIRTCRKSLEDLLVELSQYIYDSCNHGEFDKKKKVISKCVQANIYKVIINTHEYGYLEDLCRGDATTNTSRNEVTECASQMREKLSSLQLADVQRCENLDKFNTKESVVVCKELLIEKDLALLTFEEKKALGTCLKSASSNVDQIRNCMDKIRGMSDDELALEEIKEKFCAEEKGERAKKKCLEEVLSQNMDDKILPECKERATNPITKELDFLVLKKCQREKLYDEILNKDSLSVYDCWNREKFPTLEKRNECQQIANALSERIKQCEKLVGDDEVNRCFKDLAATLSPQEKEMLSFYLNKNLEMNPQCASLDELSRLLCSKYPTASEYTELTSSSIQGIPSMVDAPSSDLKPDNGASSNFGTNDGTTNSDKLLGALGAGGAVAGAGEILKDGEIRNPLISKAFGGSSVLGGAVGDGFNGIFKDITYLSFLKKNMDEDCKKIGYAALIRVSGTIAATAITIKSASDAKKELDELKDKSDGQKGSLDVLIKTYYPSVLKGLGVKMAANMAAGQLIDEAKTRALLRASSGEVVSCKDQLNNLKQSKTSFLDHSKDQLFVEMIENAESSNDLIAIFQEWEFFRNQDVENILADNTFTLPEIFNENLEVVKMALISTMQIGSNIIIGSAHANTNTSDDNKKKIQIDMRQLMNLLSYLPPPNNQGSGFQNKDIISSQKKLDDTVDGADLVTIAEDYSSTNRGNKKEIYEATKNAKDQIKETEIIRDDTT